MEFLEFLFILLSAAFIWKRPQNQRRAENFMYAATFIMLMIWFIATKEMLLPPGNY